MTTQLWAGAIAALLTGFATIATALIQFRRENHKDHDAVMEKLDKIETKMDKHEGWHEGRGDF